MKKGKFIVLAVAAGIVGLALENSELNPMEKKYVVPDSHYITKDEATALWNKLLNKAPSEIQEEEMVSISSIKGNVAKETPKPGFNPMLEPPLNHDGSHYITKDEAEKLLNDSVSKAKVIAKEVDGKINEALATSNKGMEQLIAGDLNENTNEVKKVIKAEFAPINTESLVKTKDKTIDAMIGALEKLRSEPKKETKGNKP